MENKVVKFLQIKKFSRYLKKAMGSLRCFEKTGFTCEEWKSTRYIGVVDSFFQRDEFKKVDT